MSGHAPAHLVVPGTERHGVTRVAIELAGACGAPLVTDLEEAADLPRVHVHLTDRLLGATPQQAAETLESLARRTEVTVTLHDVPQPTDGDAFERRRAAYAAIVRSARGWVVCSATERATVERHCDPPTSGGVVPLPVRAPRTDLPGLPAGPLEPGDASIGVFGWIYPGKGHAEAIAAAGLLGTTPATRPSVVAIGAVAQGHDALAEQLAAHAAALGVRLEVTGWLDDDAADRRLAEVTVGLAGHVNVSASGSVNSWLAVGRRPVVRSSDYAREMAALRPGTLELLDDDAGAARLAAVVLDRLARPDLGVLGPDAVVRPTLAEAAAAYGAWWER